MHAKLFNIHSLGLLYTATAMLNAPSATTVAAVTVSTASHSTVITTAGDGCYSIYNGYFQRSIGSDSTTSLLFMQHQAQEMDQVQQVNTLDLVLERSGDEDN